MIAAVGYVCAGLAILTSCAALYLAFLTLGVLRRRYDGRPVPRLGPEEMEAAALRAQWERER